MTVRSVTLLSQLGPGLRRGGEALAAFSTRKPIGTKFVHLPETFPEATHYPGNTPQSDPAMKHLVPIFCALIPFAAVIGACVTCP